MKSTMRAEIACFPLIFKSVMFQQSPVGVTNIFYLSPLPPPKKKEFIQDPTYV